jgi:hypothetical protein
VSNDWVYFPEYRQVMAPDGAVCTMFDHDSDADRKGYLIAASQELRAACEAALARIESDIESAGRVTAEGNALRAALALATPPDEHKPVVVPELGGEGG